MKRILYVVGFFAFLFSGTAGAANYYVKNGGNNSLNGLSDGNAWGTIAKVNTELVAGTFNYGDQIFFKKGDTWTLSKFDYLNIDGTIGGTGSTSNRLKFGAYGTGADPIIQHSSGSDTIIRIIKDYIEIDGLHLKRGGIYCWGMDYSLIENFAIEGAKRGIWLHGYCTNNEIRYNTLDAKQTLYNFLSYEGIQVGYETDTRPAPSVANQHNLIHDNVVKDWSHGQIYLYAVDYNEVYNNYVYDDALDPENHPGSGIGIAGNYNKIYNNWIETPRGQRINGQHNEVYNNVFNTFYDSDNTASNNYVIALSPNIEHPWDISYNKIFNNIFYGANEDYPHEVSSAPILIYKKLNYQHNISNNEFANNIILDWRLNVGHEDDYGFMVESEGGTGSLTNNIFKNNCFYKTGGATDKIIRHQITLYTVTEWNAADPGGNTVDGNIAVDPGLEDPANGKFWPTRESSNVVGAGASGYATSGLVFSTTWTPSISIVEVFRVKDGNLPDIGPYEWTDSTQFKKPGELRIIKIKP